MLKTILIDDEAKARENLRLLLQKHCPSDIYIAGECGNIEEAYKAIISLQPQLIFLDIEMGRGTGFDLLERFEHFPFKVVFVTAYDQYAIRAIKCCALDYLLKPVIINDLMLAVNKTKKAVDFNNDLHMQNLFEMIQKPKQKTNRIALPVQNGYRLVPADEIMYCRAEKEYTYLLHINGEEICSSLNLGEYEDMLYDYDFFRVHHSYLVNRKYIQQYVRGEGGEIVITNNHTIPVSRRKKDDFINWLTGE